MSAETPNSGETFTDIATDIGVRTFGLDRPTAESIVAHSLPSLQRTPPPSIRETLAGPFIDIGVEKFGLSRNDATNALTEQFIPTNKPQQ